MKKKIIIIAALLSLARFADAADCRKTGSVCTDTTSAKVFNGVTVTLAQVGGCWNYQDTYQCIKPDSIDYCSAIAGTAGCYQTSVSVKDYAFNGTILDQTLTYQCGSTSLTTPPNTIQLNNSYTIVQDILDNSQCQTMANNPNCHIASHTCTQGPETRIINGLPVYESCWQYQDDYTCILPTKTDDCQPLIDKGCTKLNTTCITSDPVLGCTMSQVSYSCLVTQGTTVTTQDCSARQVCQDGKCWNANSPPDGDFAQVVAVQEAAREAAKYGPDATDLFRGLAEGCTKGYLGLKNCCKTDNGAASNNSVMVQMLSGAGSMAGKEIANLGSKYMYDFLYSDGGWLDAGSQCVSPLFAPTNFSASFGMYGFSLSYAGEAAAPTFLGTESTLIGGSGAAGEIGVYFNPYALAFAVALQVIQELIACTPDEQKLGMARAANLCTYVGDYCSQKFLGACLETTSNYCCFNSKLSRIINEQGRPQIGRGWGSAEHPDCRGFSADEFRKVDFSKIDMSEFVTDIMSNVSIPDANGIANRLTTNMGGRTAN